jgi:hypothetical protein
MDMLKHVIAGAALLPLMIAPGVAQRADHHYQGGPKTEVPHHVGQPPQQGTTAQGQTSQQGQHHYTGGPSSNVPHHVGEQPKPRKQPKGKLKKKSS